MSEVLAGFDLLKVVAMVVALMIAIIGHEIMHGRAALFYGDTTAQSAGRLSLNPLKHIDPMGTIAVPAMLLLSGAPFLFGWAKPVPINVWRVLQNRGHMAMVVVSLAGIFYNLLVAFLAAQLIGFAAPESFVQMLLLYLVLWNVVLAVFNLLPIPPLDGSNAIAHLASAFGHHGIGRFFERVGMWGFVVLIVILMTDLRLPLFGAMDWLIRSFLG
jgi:Zn-dependent protease